MAGVQAGRLSIEIVAEIARLQADLDKAKRAVREASGDIARSASAANDNLSRMGTTMNGVGRMSNSMRASMINLGRQVQDVGTMFAMGAPPMQIFASQGAQIVDVLAMMSAEAKATNTSLTRMAAGGLMRMGPYMLAAAAAGGTLAIILGDITDEINENSRVTVTWSDVLLGSFDAVAAYVSGTLTSAFRSLGIDVDGVFAFIAAAARAKANEIIGNFVFAVNAIKAAWRTFPGAVVEFVIDATNGALRGIERLINGGIAMLNSFVGMVNNTLNTSLQTIGEVSLPQIENTYRGAGAAAGAAMAEAQASSYQDYIGQFLDYAQPFIEGRARDRLEAASEDAGTAAGRRMREAIEKEVEDALKQAALDAQAAADKIAEYADRERDKIKDAADEAYRLQERLDEEARRRGEDQVRDLADLYQSLFTRGIDGVWDYFKKQGMETLAMLASQGMMRLLSGQSGGGGILGILGGSAANDNGKTTQVGGIFSMLGSSGAPLAAGGPVGVAVAAAAMAISVGKKIADALSSPKGVANLSGTSILGSFGKLSGQATSAGGSVLDSIASIAAALGADVGAGGSVSIGMKGKNYRVDPTGSGAVKKGKGAIDFGQDEAAAIAYAVRNLIEDGVLTGISQASQKILQAGGDLEKAIEKAAMIEALPKLLKERLDPLGYALDEIDDKFRSLRDALAEGGATAQQYADAEKLYRLEREEAIAQFGSATSTLTAFLQDLAFGSNSPLSVRAQMSAADAAFSTFEADIRAGKTVDQDKFTAAAQSLLGLSRQANGSTAAYFSTFDRVRALTQQAIGNVSQSVPGEGTVFQQQTASNTASMARMMEDQNALLREQNELLRGANDNGGKASKFIGGKRGYQ